MAHGEYEKIERSDEEIGERLIQLINSDEIKKIGISPAEIRLKFVVPPGEEHKWKDQGVWQVDLLAIRVFDYIWILDYQNVTKEDFPSSEGENPPEVEFEAPYNEVEFFFRKGGDLKDVFSDTFVSTIQIGNALFKIVHEQRH